MNLLNRLRHALLGRPQPKPTRLPATEVGALRIDELPPFTLKIAELMQYDPQVRIGLGARNGLLLAAEVEVSGPDAAIVRWVERQWQALWNHWGQQLLRAKLYGFVPFEVVFRPTAGGEFAGLLEVARLIDHHPGDVRLLVAEDEIVGFELSEEEDHHGEQSDRVPVVGAAYHREATSHVGVASGNLDHPDDDNPNQPKSRTLLAPQSLVCTFDSQCTNLYGCALLARAYPAWFEKWMPGGAKRTLQLRMIKDGYIGDILWYPANQQIENVDGRQLSFKELAREVVASRTSGSALLLPLLYDPAGNKLIDYTPPRDVRGATQLFRWKSDLDLEIWKALEVPPEILQASTAGSGFSGRWIPFAVALSAVHAELSELIRCVDRDLLRPLAALNFGRPPQYEIRPQSLVDTYARMFGSPGPK
ncbi:MAG: hypothetical protein SFU86_02990 [Pirellulaceae bacterium]|nr:hypothetical protein [Pirellulaceae bacterium]